MNSLNFGQRIFLKDALGLSTGYVLGLSRGDVRDLFDSCGIKIESDSRFLAGGSSMGKLTIEFLKQADDSEVIRVLDAFNKLPDFTFDQNGVNPAEFRTQIRSIILGIDKSYSPETGGVPESGSGLQEVEDLIGLAETLVAQEMFVQVEGLLRSNHQHQAIEEAFKLVRERMRLITGKERASDVFGSSGQSDKYYKEIFGIETPFKELDERTRDDCVGVAHVHLAIQNFRNVFTHTPSTDGDAAVTLQYLVLASLGFESISRQLPSTVALEAKDWVTTKRREYSSATAFYRDFENLKWAEGLPITLRMRLNQVKRPVLEWLIDSSDFTISFDMSNIWLMCFQLLADEVGEEDLRRIEAKPTIDSYGNDQMAGWDEFVRSIKRTEDGSSPTGGMNSRNLF